jgi:hypothetical protein
MPPRGRGRAGSTRRGPADVFLNIPYDQKFERLYLAYVCGISSLGLVPRATLELPSSARRLDRILGLIKSCRYSIHDLSRVELDRTQPATPRFNMPFELGLSIGWEKFGSKQHAWFVYESEDFRLAKSLSDLSGTDVYVHEAKIDGVFRELCNAFVRLGRRITVQQMKHVYRDVRKSLPEIVRTAGARSIFEPRVFRDLCFLASRSANRHAASSRRSRSNV